MTARTSLLLLSFCFTVLSWNGSSIIVEKDSLSTGPPTVLSYYPQHDFLWGILPPYRVCSEEQKKRVVADLDMRKMMGRWFVGSTHYRYHRRLNSHKSRSKCFIYEFDRLLIANNISSFDVTIHYKNSLNNPVKEFSFMRSPEQRNGMLKLFSSLIGFQRGIDFWIYIIGPEGKDSFGNPQYEYAIIGNCFGIDIVLVRSPQTFKETLKYEGLGINPDYSDCFADSELVGESDEKTERNFTCDPSNVTLVEEFDIRKMMGRWFVGLTHNQYHRRLKSRNYCFVYEFDRPLIAHNITSFDVTINYRSATNFPMKDFSFMRSTEQRNGLLKHFSSSSGNLLGVNFWIYKLGPEGRDSFGRPQYEHAIIGDCTGIDIVLVRNPQTFKDIYKSEILNWMESNGLGINADYQFTQPSYSNCYSDSVTETFRTSDEWTRDPYIRPSFHQKPESNYTCDQYNFTISEEIDTRKMMGRWFEGLTSLPTDNQTCVVFEYKRLEFVGLNFTADGHYTISFQVHKKYRKDGYSLKIEKDDSITLWSTDQGVPKFGSQFWVVKVGPEEKEFSGRIQYEYVLVSNCEKSFVRVLVRNPHKFNEVYKNSVLTWLEENGFNIAKENRIYQPDYIFCNYADSVTVKIGQ